jgi:hypothetical protein
MNTKQTIAVVLSAMLCAVNWGYLVLAISGVLIYLLLNNKTK